MGCALGGAWASDAPQDLVRRVTLLNWDIAAAVPESVATHVLDFAPDVIYHLAALSIPSECGHHEPTPEAVRVNVGGTEHVIEMAARLSSRPRVLLVSSCRVYAAIDEKSPQVAETYPLAPATAYAKTKLAAEEVLQQRGGELGVAGIDSYLDLSDVRDVVRAYRLLAEHGHSGEAYNVGRGVAVRSGDIFHQLRRMHDPQRSYVELSPGPHQDPIADLAKLQSIIPWRPEISRETASG
jgi:GDP-4-dehydro-6-deoxy-D-mannose reductase